MEGAFAGRFQKGLVHTGSKATVTVRQRATGINPDSRSAGKRLERAFTAVHRQLPYWAMKARASWPQLHWSGTPGLGGLTDSSSCCSSCPLFVDLMGSVPCTAARLVISILAWPSSPFLTPSHVSRRHSHTASRCPFQHVPL